MTSDKIQPPAYTQGRWERYGYIGDRKGLNRVRAVTGVDGFDRPICVDLPANESDARIMAASLVMLKALKRVWLMPPFDSEERRIVVDAINKAEGGAQ